MQNKTLKAVRRIINSVWTLEYKLEPDQLLEIVRYSREDVDGYNREHELPKMTLIEDGNRIVHYVEIAGKRYTVVNPAHIFSYKPVSINPVLSESNLK
jgi:hypothetical protein